MTTVSSCCWLAWGTSLGMAHVALLVRISRHNRKIRVTPGEIRLLLVAAGIGAAAVAGGLIPTALGWAAGFAIACGAVWENLA